MSGAKLRPLSNPEVCVNLWAYADEGGYIARVAARAYVLDGDGDDKLSVLHRLAVSDFMHAEWMGVSKQFVIEGSDGERMEGIAHASMLSDGVTPGVLFEPLFKRLEQSIPQQACVGKNGYEPFSLPLPEDPLTVTTVVVEFEDGRLVPMLSGVA